MTPQAAATRPGRRHRSGTAATRGGRRDHGCATNRGAPPGGRGGDGLVTLEWLLIVAAATGMAAVSALAVQTVLDDTSEIPDDPAVRVADADIAGAFLAAEANAAILSGPYSDPDFRARCETDLELEFEDVAASAAWTTPSTTLNPPDPPRLHIPARCIVVLRAGLGD